MTDNSHNAHMYDQRTYFYIPIRTSEMNITGTLPTNKLPIFFLKSNLTSSHTCLEVKTRMFMSWLHDWGLFACVKRMGLAFKFDFIFPVGGSVPVIFPFNDSNWLNNHMIVLWIFGRYYEGWKYRHQRVITWAVEQPQEKGAYDNNIRLTLRTTYILRNILCNILRNMNLWPLLRRLKISPSTGDKMSGRTTTRKGSTW
jgi:hypothetical protein